MKIEVEGAQVEVRDVYFREWKYGKSTFGLPLRTYRIRVGVVDVVDAVAPYYEECADEDRRYGFDATQTDLRLRALGWPPLATVASRLPDLLIRYLEENAYQVVQGLFARQPQGPEHRYSINNVRSIELVGEEIELRGDAILLDGSG